MTQMQDALVDGGVARADLQTSNADIHPTYGRQGRITGYAVKQGLAAKLRTTSEAGALISAGIAAGGDAAQLFGVSFEIEDDDELLTAARQRAFADAQAKAELYAAEAGRTLGQVVSVTEEVPSYGFGQAYASGSAEAFPIPLEPGREQLAVTVTVERSSAESVARENKGSDAGRQVLSQACRLWSTASCPACCVRAPDRLDDRVEPPAALLSVGHAGNAPEDICHCPMKPVWKSRSGEGRRDLFHLGDPAPALRAGGLCGLERALRQFRKRDSPLVEQGLLDAVRACGRPDGEQEGGCPLRPRRIGHLQCRRSTGFAIDDSGVQGDVLEQLSHCRRVLTTDIESRGGGRARGRTDDAAVDEPCAAGLDDSAYLAGGVR
jgi:Protein of unknown function (DUF541)